MVLPSFAGHPQLTTKQQQVLATIALSIVRHEGVAPTFEEIAVEQGCTKTTILEHIRNLERMGFIQRDFKRDRFSVRSIRVLQLPPTITDPLPEAARAIGVRPVTLKQLKILQFIIAYQCQHRDSPTIEEIALERGVTKITIYQHLRQLELRGCLHRTPFKPRSIEVLYHPPVPPADECPAGTTGHQAKPSTPQPPFPFPLPLPADAPIQRPQPPRVPATRSRRR